MLINSLLPTAHKLLPILSRKFLTTGVRLQSTVSWQLKDVCQNFGHHFFIDHEATLYFQLGPGLIYHHWTSGQIYCCQQTKNATYFSYPTWVLGPL
jgi:hypothetical protein